MNSPKSARTKRGHMASGFAGIVCVMTAVFLFASCEQPGGPGPERPVITITAQPAGRTIVQDEISGSLSVEASVTEGAALSYQWYSNTSDSNSGGTIINGGTAMSFAIPTDLTVPKDLTEETYYYYCVVSATDAASVRSNAAKVTVYPPGTVIISIDTQPADRAVTEDGITGNLSVEASATGGTALSYQWYSNTSGSNTGGTAVTGETEMSFAIPKDLTEGTYYYFCEISATDTAVVRSNAAKVTVYPPGTVIISIETQPVDLVVTQGNITGNLSVTASAEPDTALSYQWYSNTSDSNSGGTIINGATEMSFAIPKDLAQGTYYYYCKISAEEGEASVSSGAVTVTVKASGTPINLTVNTWADGYLPESDYEQEQWFSFTAAAETQYIHAYFSSIPGFYVQLYNSDREKVGDRKLLRSRNFPWSGDMNTVSSTSLSVKSGELYYIAVTSYHITSPGYNEGYTDGSYRIGLNASSKIPPFTKLEPDTWANGEILSSFDTAADWFSFTAAAETQYIHVRFETFEDVYIQLYDSNGFAVGDRTNLSGEVDRFNSTKYIPRPVKKGETYYIQVTDYYSKLGTYKIGVTASSMSPDPFSLSTELTVDTWTDGDFPDETYLYKEKELWFRFTATGETQYIHARLGTLGYLDVQLYGRNGIAVGDGIYLSRSTIYTSRSVVTSGETYYIRIRHSNGGENYGTYKIGFSASVVPPELEPINLPVNTWADGNIPTEDGEEWFSFTPAGDTQYIHARFDTLTRMYVQLYDRNGIAVGDDIYLGSLVKYTSLSVTSEEPHYIRVRPDTSMGVNNYGTYEIGFTASVIPPEPIKLTVDTWADGDIPTEDGEEWFSFTATGDTQYIHARFDTLDDLYVQLYDSKGIAVGDGTNFYDNTTYISRPVTREELYYIKVWPTTYGSGSGTYEIGVTTAPTPPEAAAPIKLEFDTWADGDIPTQGGEQWFSFTAAADWQQYIHARFGTLDDLYVQLYDSKGKMVGDETNLYDNTTYISQSVTNGDLYYIKVTPSDSYSGTYEIGFTATPAPPADSP